MMESTLSWEEAVLWLREQPDQQDLVNFCYYDDPLGDAAQRFHRSEEWAATRELLRNYLPGKVLDLGAGRGIASYAFARDGCEVTALEPDPSPIVGRGAINQLARQFKLPISTVEAYGEKLPFPKDQFDIVYGRAVLHHAKDLQNHCFEIHRVLRPRGAVLWIREHVISKPSDRQVFLANHPLHSLYGGENAFLLEEYAAAIINSGLRLRRIIGPLENAVNYYPSTKADVINAVTDKLAGRLGKLPARAIMTCPLLQRLAIRLVSRRSKIPGRHFSFLGTKV